MHKVWLLSAYAH